MKVRWVEMTQEQKSAAMQRARLNARENAPDTEIPPTTRVLAVSSGKGGVGKSSVTVNLAAALAARGLRVGVLDADIWGFSVPRMLGVDGRLSGEDGKIVPHHLDVANADGGAAGTLEIVSMGFLVEDESTALMWRGLILTKAVEQFLTDVRWGELDYLLIDMPPGTGDVQMGLARMLPQAEMLVVTTPARNAQKVATRVADMARRSYMKVVGVVENMSEFVAPDGQRFALFGRGGGAALGRGDRRTAGGVDPARARGLRRRRHRHGPSCSARPTRPRERRSTRSRHASSTSCSRRSRWRAARRGSSSWRPRTSPPPTPPKPDPAPAEPTSAARAGPAIPLCQDRERDGSLAASPPSCPRRCARGGGGGGAALPRRQAGRRLSSALTCSSSCPGSSSRRCCSPKRDRTARSSSSDSGPAALAGSCPRCSS